jgi:hypothetical protein
VRFLRDSIDSWAADGTGFPLGVSDDDRGISRVKPGTRPRIDQMLSTRAGNELSAADSFGSGLLPSQGVTLRFRCGGSRTW